MNRCVTFVLTVAQLGLCAFGCSVEASRVSPTGATNDSRPAWFEISVQESTQMMEPRCTEHAPLELLQTDDPLFLECEHDAMMAAASAIQTVYDAALADCELLEGKSHSLDVASRRKRYSCKIRSAYATRHARRGSVVLTFNQREQKLVDPSLCLPRGLREVVRTRQRLRR